MAKFTTDLIEKIDFTMELNNRYFEILRLNSQ